MVRRFFAAVEPHEGADRRPVRQAHHVGGNEAKRVHVPARAFVEVRRFDDEMTQFRHLRRFARRTLRIVDPDYAVGSVVRNSRTQRQSPTKSLAMQDVHGDAVGAHKADKRPAARGVRGLDRAPSRLRQKLQILSLRNRKAEPSKAGTPGERDAINVGRGSRPPHEQFGLRPRSHDEAEVRQILFRFGEIGPLEMDEQKLVRLHDRRRAALQFYTAGSGVQLSKGHGSRSQRMES